MFTDTLQPFFDAISTHIGAPVRHFVHPEPLTAVSQLFDPFNSHPSSILSNQQQDNTKSSSTNGTLSTIANEHDAWKYAFQLEFIQGICFAVTAVLLLTCIVVAMLRNLYGRCGARLSKSGYTLKTVRYTKYTYVAAAVFFCLAIVGSLLANSSMFLGIGEALDVFQRTLTPLPPAQQAFLNQIVDSNAPLFEAATNGQLETNLTQVWNAGLSAEEVMAVWKEANLTLASQLPIQSVVLLDGTFLEMTRAHAAANKAVDHLNKLYLALNVSRNETDRDATSVAKLKNLISRVQTDLTPSFFESAAVLNATLQAFSTILPKEDVDVSDSPIHYIASGLLKTFPGEINDETPFVESLETILALPQTYIATTMTIPFERCQEAPTVETAVPQGGENMALFTRLMYWLNAWHRVGLILLVVISLISFLLSSTGGGVAWWKNTGKLFLMTGLFVTLTLLTAFSFTGLLIPSAIVTSDACGHPELFSPVSVFPPPTLPPFYSPIDFDQPDQMVTSDTPAPHQNYSLAMSVPTCALCDQDVVFGPARHFSTFIESVMERARGEWSSINVPLASDDVSVSMDKIVSVLKGTTFGKVNKVKTSYEKELKKLNSTVSEKLKDYVVQTAEAVDDWKTALDVVANMAPRLESQWKETTKSLEKFLKEVSATIGKIESKAKNQAKTVMTSVKKLEHGWVAASNKSVTEACRGEGAPKVDQATYDAFQDALCRQTRAGLDASWFFQLLMVVVAIPVILTSMKAYKIMAFTSAMEVDYAGVRPDLIRLF